MEFRGVTYKLNQCEDLLEWCSSSLIGEYTRYYDNCVFHTASGIVAAYADNLDNYCYI